MTALTFFELFAGGGGLSMGLELAGWRCVGHAEIEPHARAVLRKRWPETPLHGDVAKIDGATLPPFTLLSGGSPCQDISVAGKRSGMTEGSGTRSSLFHEQVRIWRESDAPYFLWENVLGAFSSNKGRDFAAVLSSLVGSAIVVPKDGWRSGGVAAGRTGVAAWRVCDAQFFGVPQRRRRVFVLCARAGGVDPAAVLSLAEGLRGHLAARDETGEGVAGDVEAGARGGAVAIRTAQTSANGHGIAEDVSHTLDGANGQAVIAFDTKGTEVHHDLDVSQPLRAMGSAGSHPNDGGQVGVVAFAQNQRGELRTSEAAPQLTTGGGKPGEGYAAVVAFSTEQTPKVFTDGVAPTLRQPSRSGGGQPDCVVAFEPRYFTRDNATGGAPAEISAPLKAGSKAGDGEQVVVAFKPSHYTRGKDGAPSDIAAPLSADADRGDQELIIVPLDMRQLRRGETNTKSGRGGESITSGTPGTGIGEPGDPSYTVGAEGGVPAIIAYQPHGMDSRVTPTPTPTLHARAGTGGGNVPLVLSSGQANAEIGEDVSTALTALTALHEAPIVVAPTLAAGAHPGSYNGQDAVPIAEAILTAETLRASPALEDGKMVVAGTLDARHAGGFQSVQSAAAGHLPISAGRPRRLMPIECERLMGWNDGSTQFGILTADSCRELIVAEELDLDPLPRPYEDVDGIETDEEVALRIAETTKEVKRLRRILKQCETAGGEIEYELSDSARYRLCGNGVARYVMAWIGFRLRDEIHLLEEQT